MDDAREHGAMRMHGLFVRAAWSFGVVFGWVAIFSVFLNEFRNLTDALAFTALIYAAGKLTVAATTPLFARALRHGTRRLMLYGTLLGASAFFFLGSIWPEGGAILPFIPGALLFSIALGLHRALYRVPYVLGLVHSFGSERPVSRFSSEILISVLPAFAGFLLAMPGGETSVFYAALACMLLSALPAFNVGDERPEYTWGYRETYRRLFSPEYRAISLASLATGFETGTLHFIWPIAAALLVGMQFDLLGTIISLTLFVVFLVDTYARGWWQKLHIDTSAPVRASAAFSAWIFRLTIAGPFAIVATDAFQKLAPGGDRVPAVHLSADGSSYLDEATVLKEVAGALGKLAAVSILLIALAVADPAVALGITILIAALAAAWHAAASVKAA